MQKIRITKAPETIDDEAVAHWQALVGCVVEAGGQSVLQIHINNPDLPSPEPGNHELFIGDLLEALSVSNPFAMRFWGQKLDTRSYLVLIPHDCAEILDQQEQLA